MNTMPLIRWSVAEQIQTLHQQTSDTPPVFKLKAHWTLRSHRVDRRTQAHISRLREGVAPIYMVVTRPMPIGTHRDTERQWCPMCATWTPDDYNHFLYECPGPLGVTGRTLMDYRRKFINSIKDPDLRQQARHGIVHPIAIWKILERENEHQSVVALGNMVRFRSKYFHTPHTGNRRDQPSQFQTNAHAIDPIPFQESIQRALNILNDCAPSDVLPEPAPGEFIALS